MFGKLLSEFVVVGIFFTRSPFCSIRAANSLLSILLLLFLLVLQRFVKIRHYGILASVNKPKLRDVQFGMGIIVETKPKPTWQEVCKQKLNFDPELCPHCKTGHFHTVSTWSARAPPAINAHHRAVITAAAQKISF